MHQLVPRPSSPRRVSANKPRRVFLPCVSPTPTSKTSKHKPQPGTPGIPETWLIQTVCSRPVGGGGTREQSPHDCSAQSGHAPGPLRRRGDLHAAGSACATRRLMRLASKSPRVYLQSDPAPQPDWTPHTPRNDRQSHKTSVQHGTSCHPSRHTTTRLPKPAPRRSGTPQGQSMLPCQD